MENKKDVYKGESGNIFDLNFYNELIDLIKDSVAFSSADTYVDLNRYIGRLMSTDILIFNQLYKKLVDECKTSSIKQKRVPVDDHHVYLNSPNLKIVGNELQIQNGENKIYIVNLKGLNSVIEIKKVNNIKIPSTKTIYEKIISNISSYVFAKEANDYNLYSLIKEIQNTCKLKDNFSIGELAHLILSLNELIREKITYKTLTGSFLNLFYIENKNKERLLLEYQFEKVILKKATDVL